MTLFQKSIGPLFPPRRSRGTRTCARSQAWAGACEPAVLGWPAGIMRLPVPHAKFARQLQDARDARQRQAPHEATDADLEALGLSQHAIVPMHNSATALRTALADVLGCDARLERLHRALPGFSPRETHHAATIRAKTAMLAPLADPRRAAPFWRAYDAMVCEVVVPHLAAALGSAGHEHEHERFYYAAVPTVRVQQPSELCTIRPHCDGMYGLQAGSLNWWLPLTRVASASTLHVESRPGSEDFAPLLPAPGEAVRFDGRRCLHYTLPNRSMRTRVSLDFRVVPGRYFEPGNRLSRRGYYSAAARGADGSYAKVCAGRVSLLHGMPHAAPAIVVDEEGGGEAKGPAPPPVVAGARRR